MIDKIKLNIPIAVEGKYDKIKLSSIADAQIITTEGFGVFASKEKATLIRRIAEPRGIIVLTDSDGAGLVIRNYFNSILPKEKLFHIYIPKIEGKEKRKKSPSKEGTLGVEGIDADLLRKLLAPFVADEPTTRGREVTKTDFFADGLSGGDGSAERRRRLCERLALPDNMSANALLAAVNLLCDYDKYKEMVENA